MDELKWVACYVYLDSDGNLCGETYWTHEAHQEAVRTNFAHRTPGWTYPDWTRPIKFEDMQEPGESQIKKPAPVKAPEPQPAPLDFTSWLYADQLAAAKRLYPPLGEDGRPLQKPVVPPKCVATKEDQIGMMDSMALKMESDFWRQTARK